MNTSNSESAMTAPGNPGERLRQAREARHWSRAEVALQLHLSEDAVRYIEDGLFDKLPGATFSRGYIRSYAKLLGLDGAALAQEFDQFTGAQPTASTPQGLSQIREPARLSQNVLRGGLFVLSLVAVGIGVLWWQERYGAAPAQVSAPIERVEVDTADGSTEVLTLDEPEDQAVQAAQVPIDLLEAMPQAERRPPRARHRLPNPRSRKLPLSSWRPARVACRSASSPTAGCRLPMPPVRCMSRSSSARARAWT